MAIFFPSQQQPAKLENIPLLQTFPRPLRLESFDQAGRYLADGPSGNSEAWEPGQPTVRAGPGDGNRPPGLGGSGWGLGESNKSQP